MEGRKLRDLAHDGVRITEGWENSRRLPSGFDLTAYGRHQDP